MFSLSQKVNICERSISVLSPLKGVFEGYCRLSSLALTHIHYRMDQIINIFARKHPCLTYVSSICNQNIVILSETHPFYNYSIISIMGM